LLVPAFFKGWVPLWLPIMTFALGAITYAVCLTQSRRP
jgi:hypothetical protein